MPTLARETYLDALTAAIWARGADAPDVILLAATAARAAPPAPQPERALDVVLDALAIRLTEGFVAAGPLLARALNAVRDLGTGAGDVGHLLWFGGNRISAFLATEVWDFGAARALAERQVELARTSGALVQLQFALNLLATNEILSGNLAAAGGLIEEARVAAEATANQPVAYTAMLLTAYRGHEQASSRLIDSARSDAVSMGEGRMATFADYASSVLSNGLGRHDLALAPALRVLERDVIGGYQVMAVAELAEAASRMHDRELLALARSRSTERATVTGTDWALGIQARIEALADDGPAADVQHRESIERLDRAGLKVEVARGHLLYGEWLRRGGRRVDARAELRIAFDQSVGMGLDGFAERARTELLATGEKVRKRSVDTADNLTAQEFQIARLARDGLSNTEIGARLFLSPRTVEWHLRKVFTKVNVTSRRQLRDVALDFGPAHEVASSGTNLEPLIH